MQKIKFISKYSIENIESTNIATCVEYLSNLKIIGIDIETCRKYKIGTFSTKKEKVYRGGLDPYLSDIVMLQVGDVNEQFVIDVRDFSEDDLQPILDIINYNKDIILVGHNLKFEQKHLKHKYGINFHTIYDTMLGEMILYNGETTNFSLADLAKSYLGIQKTQTLSLFGATKEKSVTLDDELLKEEDVFITPFEVEDNAQIDKSIRMQFVNIEDRKFNYKQVAYGSDDIIYPILIREKQLVGRKLKDGYIHKPTKWIKNEMHYCLFLADMELNGIPVDTELWNNIYEDNLVIYRRREQFLTDFIVDKYQSLTVGNFDLFTNKPVCIIKWTSSKQVVDLYKKWDKCPKAYSKQTKKIEYTVGAVELLRILPNSHKLLYEKNKDLEKIECIDDFTLQYLLFKKAEQCVTTFGKEWTEKYVHPLTNRCHSNYRQILNTTRISSVAPNLNNISNGAWRDCFKVSKGNVMINLDFSSQEVRALSSLSKDQNLIDFFVKGDDSFGDDFHSFTATKVYSVLENNPDLFVPPKEIKDENDNLIDNPLFTSDDKRRRTNSKQFTFGLAFGKAAYTFAQDLGITVKEAEKIINSYLVAFPGLKTYFDKADKMSKYISHIVIDKYTGALWNCNFREELDALTEDAWSYFPPHYAISSKKEQIEIRANLYIEYPELKGKFQKMGKLKGSLKNRLQNYPIQGLCAQIMKIAMNMVRKEIIENNYEDLKIIGNIYDETLGEALVENGDKYGKMIKKCMEKAGETLSPDVPQIANYVLQNTWGH